MLQKCMFQQNNEEPTNANTIDEVFEHMDLIEHNKKIISKSCLDPMVHMSYGKHQVLRNCANFLTPDFQKQESRKDAIVKESSAQITF